ncbi:hypothetical protein [Ornithinimicrobium sp. Y1694]|uniref:hypothetical protein n=1 Tax=Ornithinimicrobium sp. Y1694 TaxID=3418590 RepID=UPI003CF0F57B
MTAYESRPKAAPESFGGDTSTLPSRTDRPTWDALVEATINASAIYYNLGYSQGWHDALSDRDAQHRQVAAARIAQDHLDVHLARQKAAARWSA